MYRLHLIPLVGLFILVACNSARKPSAENFTGAINQYLAKHGEACTSIGRQFPIDIPASAQQSQYGFGPQLAALRRAGLVSETDTTTVVHGMLDALRCPTPLQPVKRFQLTADGQKYFQQVLGTFGQTGGICYGQKAVGSILKWGVPVTMGGYPQIEVTYTYKLVNLAPWAEESEIQQSFPDIAATVKAASKAKQNIGLRLTNNVWEVVGR